MAASPRNQYFQSLGGLFRIYSAFAGPLPVRSQHFKDDSTDRSTVSLRPALSVRGHLGRHEGETLLGDRTVRWQTAQLEAVLAGQELGNLVGGGLEEFSLFKCNLLNEADIYPA
jgi:hypothetical protein